MSKFWAAIVENAIAIVVRTCVRARALPAPSYCSLSDGVRLHPIFGEYTHECFAKHIQYGPFPDETTGETGKIDSVSPRHRPPALQP